LLRPGFLNGVDSADEAVVETRILLFNKPGELRIGWRAA